MPTLQEIVRQLGPQSNLPAPTVPASPPIPEAGAILPEAKLETPGSAVQAIEELARQRYGDAFVEQYGDVLGFRPTTFQDRLRNVFEILGSNNPAAARELAFQGAQTRAELEQSMIEQAAQQRKELADLYSFIPTAIKAGMSAKTIRQLFSEQFTAITGDEPHPGVIDSLIEMEKTGKEPVGKIIKGLRDGTVSMEDATSLSTQAGAALRAFTEFEKLDLQKRKTDLDVTREGDRAHRTLIQKKRVKESVQRSRYQSRDRIFNSLLTSRRMRNPAEALAFANRAAGLPPPTPDEVEAVGGIQPPGLVTGPTPGEDVIEVE